MGDVEQGTQIGPDGKRHVVEQPDELKPLERAILELAETADKGVVERLLEANSFSMGARITQSTALRERLERLL